LPKQIQQKRKSTATSTTPPKRSSAPKKSKTHEKLPYENTDEENFAQSQAEVKAHFSPKKPPPKLFIPPNTVRHFVETRENQVELATDYDHSLGQFSRADYERKYGSRPLKGKTNAQLGQQENQSVPP
jgi:hypothetical protein